MNFIRSVAVSSIIGHILGIGDRHLGNILIDQGSGEVVHIDFGFVFEQGKVREKAIFGHHFFVRTLTLYDTLASTGP